MDIAPLQQASARSSFIRYNYSERVSGAMSNTTQSGTDSFEYSRTASIEAFLYTSEGLTGALPAGNASPDAGTNTSAAAGDASSSSPLSGDYHAQFLEIIKNRVEYLLNALVNVQNASDTAIPASDGTNVANDVQSVDLGYWSPEKTAGRIVDFALSFYSGGDRSEFAAMVRDAVNKGYEEALGAAGGSLPGVASDTISLVMNALDTFESGSGVDTSA